MVRVLAAEVTDTWKYQPPCLPSASWGKVLPSGRPLAGSWQPHRLKITLWLIMPTSPIWWFMISTLAINASDTRPDPFSIFVGVFAER
jgi:hypothetical protein